MRMYKYIATVYSCTLLCVDLSKSVVAQLVHEAVEQNRGALTIHTELALRSEVVSLLNVTALLSTTTNTNHPKELIDICIEKGRGKEEERKREREREGGRESNRASKSNSCHLPSEA